jgi:hypothetical protein
MTDLVYHKSMNKLLWATFVLAITISASRLPSIGGTTDDIYSKTYIDLMGFLQDDQTNTLQWTPEFNCASFSEVLISNAITNGFVAHSVIVDWGKIDNQGYGSHEFVAFATVDHGIILVEPQNDEEYLWSGIKEGHLCSANFCWPENAQSIYYPNGSLPEFLYTKSG